MSDRLDYDEPADDIAAPPDGWGEYAALSAEIESLKERLRAAALAGADDEETAAEYRAKLDERMALEMRLLGIEPDEAPDSIDDDAAAPDEMSARVERAASALVSEQHFETAPALLGRIVAAVRESLRRTTDHRERAALRPLLAGLEEPARRAVAYDTARRDPANPAWTPDSPPEADHRPELVDFEAVAALVESLARQVARPLGLLLGAAEHRAAAQQTPDPARAAAHLTAAAFAEAAERAALLAAYLAAALRRLDELRAPPEPPPRRRPCVIRGTPAPVVRQPAAPHGPPTRAPRDRVAVLATA